MARILLCGLFLASAIAATMAAPGHTLVAAVQPQDGNPRTVVTAVRTGGSPTLPPLAGGLGEEREADDKLRELVEKLRPVIIERICSQFKNSCPPKDSKIDVLAFKSQTVAGVNYFVRLRINDVHYHARIHYQSWTNTLQLTEVKGPVEAHTPISYFQ